MNPVYHKLSGFRPVAKSYSLKFLFIAFLGIHIPLIGLIVFIVLHPRDIPTSTVFILTLGLTLAATVVTLLVLKGLLAPLHITQQALEQYIQKRKLPDLPLEYPDEAGLLMHRTQETIVKLDNLIEEKKDLIGLLSHDLRMPLASIKLISEHLKYATNLTTEEQQRIATMIWNSAEEQIRIFQKILDILKYEDMEKLTLSRKNIPARPLVQAAWAELQQEAQRKDITLAIDDDYNSKITVDHMIFSQVIKNLLSNAIKFSKPGSEITIDILKKTGAVAITVRDTGIGFDSANAEELFERFTSHRQKGTHDEPSVGMGLYLSRKIVEAHEGKLFASSPGKNLGALFTIELRA